MLLAAAVALFFIILTILLKWAKEKNEYWRRKNIKHLPPKLIFGNSYESVTGRKHMGEIIEQAYLKFPNENVVGYYEFMRPQLIIRNPQLIEKVLIKDFSHFTDRSYSPINTNKLTFTQNQFNMSEQQWRALRYKLAPSFTSGKLEDMFGPLAECGENLSVLLDGNDNGEVDMKELMNLFSIDVIGSCVFGIDAGMMLNPSSKFRENVKKIFAFDAEQVLRLIAVFGAPQLANKLGIYLVKPNIFQYFCGIVLDSIKFREKHDIKRNDFVQLLIELKTLAKIEMPLSETTDETLAVGCANCEIMITDELIMGTAFGFIAAGFHMTASTLVYALYELTLQPHILKRVRQEIKDQMAVHGDITHDALRCMTYLDKIIKETLRLHPAAPTISRVCTKAYTLPCGLQLEPGDTVLIPVLALHRDPFLHKDPYCFNPDRFQSPPALCTYLPFGEGPRMCIAGRFALLEVKFAISKILLSYDIELSQRTRIPIKMNPRGLLNTPLNEVLFNISKIKRQTVNTI